MKKLLSILFILVSVSFLGCNWWYSRVPREMVGSWELIAVEYGGYDLAGGDELVLTINKDKTYSSAGTVTGESFTESGTIIIDTDTAAIKFVREDQSEEDVDELTYGLEDDLLYLHVIPDDGIGRDTNTYRKL